MNGEQPQMRLRPINYVRLIWSSPFLLSWPMRNVLSLHHRIAMLWESVFMAPFGLTEPLFVSEYWVPSILFDLPQRTGFDIKSIVFKIQ